MIGQGRDNAHLYPTRLFILLRFKFDNDVIIELGRVARLGNGPSLRGRNRRNGGKIKQNGSRKSYRKFNTI